MFRVFKRISSLKRSSPPALKQSQMTQCTLCLCTDALHAHRIASGGGHNAPDLLECAHSCVLACRLLVSLAAAVPGVANAFFVLLLVMAIFAILGVQATPFCSAMPR